ncbi:MAG: amino acid ABC transporter substrate-binding protein [Clostridiales bacterium]|nr:amino acid ABC transporter substrate-binding protein [Clostridiales bacterium]
MKQFGIVLGLSLTVLSVVGCQKSNKGSETTVLLEKDLLEEIQERGKLLVGTEGTYAPFTYHDDAGELVGYDVEVGKAIAEEMGLEAEFIETNWDACIAGLDAKRYDVVMNQVGITSERIEKYDFSTPYTISRAALIVKSDNEELTTFEGLNGKKSANSFTSNFAKMAEGYGAEIISTDGLFSKAIELVLSGRADATINDEVSFYDFMKQKPDAEVKIAATLEEASENAVLIRKGNDSFTKAINEALASLESKGILTEISEKYFGIDISK